MSEAATSRPWPADLEGTLLAQRRVIVALARLVCDRGGPDGVTALAALLDYADQSEDPGAMPDEAFAAQRVAEAEVARILRELRETTAVGVTDQPGSPLVRDLPER